VLSATRGFPTAAHPLDLQPGRPCRIVPQGRHILAAGSGHAIHHQRPRLVADTIIQIIAETRR
jgi:hypothetical protein